MKTTTRSNRGPVAKSKFKPILFSTPMVKAILEGRKTQTRRIIKEAAGWDTNRQLVAITEDHADGGRRFVMRNIHGHQRSISWYTPKYQVGDVLWVRETWRVTDFLHKEDENWGYIYKASENGHDWESNDDNWNWRPSIFMPKQACRIFLEVTAVRAERLHDITGDDVLSEGVDNGKSNKSMGVRWENMQRMAFEELWNKINKNWNDNPFVWVYGFKVVDRPAGFLG
jgi:hypothetical protein